MSWQELAGVQGAATDSVKLGLIEFLNLSITLYYLSAGKDLAFSSLLPSRSLL